MTTDAYRGAVQTWILRSEAKTVLVTGIGNWRLTGLADSYSSEIGC